MLNNKNNYVSYNKNYENNTFEHIQKNKDNKYKLWK